MNVRYITDVLLKGTHTFVEQEVLTASTYSFHFELSALILSCLLTLKFTALPGLLRPLSLSVLSKVMLNNTTTAESN